MSADSNRSSSSSSSSPQQAWAPQSPAAAGVAAAQAQHQANAQAAQKSQEQDAQDRQRRAEAQAQTNAQLLTEEATRAAEAAKQTAEVAERRAEELKSGEEFVTMDLHKSVGLNIPGGGTRRYGPGKGLRIPKRLADYLKTQPTYATSGNPAEDLKVRSQLERDHGFTELASQEDTTQRAVAAAGEALGEGGEEGDTNRRAARSAGASSGGDKPALSAAELDAMPADEVRSRYDAAVRSGRIPRAIPDGKGSGASGGVVKSDHVAALVKAGEK